MVVANPANTNCLVAAKHAPSIPRKNFSALTRLDMNRARALLAKRINTSPDKVQNVAIFGNHSKTQVPHAANAIAEVNGVTSTIPKLVGDDAWLQSEFISMVQQRGAAVINARGLSSAMSAANATKDHLRYVLVLNWYTCLIL
jgi:malate dehydrogenase